MATAARTNASIYTLTVVFAKLHLRSVMFWLHPLRFNSPIRILLLQSVCSSTLIQICCRRPPNCAYWRAGTVSSWCFATCTQRPFARSLFLKIKSSSFSLNWLVISTLVPAPGRWPSYRRPRRCFWLPVSRQPHETTKGVKKKNLELWDIFNPPTRT